MSISTIHTVSVDLLENQLVIEQVAVEDLQFATATGPAIWTASIPLGDVQNSPEVVAQCLEEAAKLVRVYSANASQFAAVAAIREQVETDRDAALNRYGAHAIDHFEETKARLGAGFFGSYRVVAEGGEPKR